MKRLVLFLFAALFLVSNSEAMRTPLSPIEKPKRHLKSKAKTDAQEAKAYFERIQKFEKNRIFFLIQPWIENRQKMG